jgi:hypothetical protein
MHFEQLLENSVEGFKQFYKLPTDDKLFHKHIFSINLLKSEHLILQVNQRRYF